MSTNLETNASAIAGILPQGSFGRFILLWAAVNIVLTLLPVVTEIGNQRTIIAGILPLTILWSYAVFLSNCVMGLVFYLLRARGAAEEIDLQH